MIRRLYRVATVLFFLSGFAEPKSPTILVTGLRSWSHPGSDRIVIDTSGTAEYRVYRAANPERLFLEIPHSRPWIDNSRQITHKVNSDLVGRVRVSEASPETTRIIFDLAGSPEFRVVKLRAPNRIVVELSPGKSISRQKDPHPQLPAVISRAEGSPTPVPGASDRDAGASGILQQVSPEAASSTTRVLPALHPAVANAPAKPASDATHSFARVLGLKVTRIVIDAGHGGHDDGTVGPHGVREKDIVLDVALRLATLVRSRLNAEVILTRSDDTFVPLTERTAIANEHNADLLLSIHANSSPTPSVAGIETYLLNLTGSPGAIAVAARENAGSDKSIGDLRDLVQSIALNDKAAESQTFAAAIQSSLFAQAVKSNSAARDRGVRRAPFVVLIGARMPSVLAEIGFLSNARDENNLNTPAYRQNIAESLCRGLIAYSKSLSYTELARTSEPR